MLYENGIERIHLELTNKCNASCPLCPRRTYNPKKLTEVTLGNFKLFFPKSFLQQITHFSFCGNFGEPTLCKDILKIHEYIYSCNPNTCFNISTNGGARNVDFWSQLGKFYADIKDTKSSVKFCIDGLEDTNHLYRVNISWKLLMQHVAAFNSSGAISEWSFIPFKHNQHQFEEIQRLYKQLGFSILHLRHCRPINDKDRHLFSYRHNNQTITLESTDDPFFIGFQREVSNAPQGMRCVARQKRELYVDCCGNVFPCCWYGTQDPTTVDPRFSLFHQSIDSILSNSFFDFEVTDTWKICDSKCNSWCWSLRSTYY